MARLLNKTAYSFGIGAAGVIYFLAFSFKISACHVPYFLGLSPSFSGLPTTFPPVPDPFPCVFSYSYPFCSLPLSSDLPRHPSLPCFPSISLFLLVSFQFSILGSDRSESGSLLSIRLHSCSATTPFSVDLRTLLSFDLMTPVFSFGL